MTFATTSTSTSTGTTISQMTGQLYTCTVNETKSTNKNEETYCNGLLILPDDKENKEIKKTTKEQNTHKK